MILRHKNSIVIALVLILHCTRAFTRPMKYERKSVSFINKLIYVNSTPRMPERLANCYLAEMKQSLEMKRFDYNSIPAPVLAEFRRRAGDRELSIDEVEELLDQTIVPEIVSILDIKKEMRARELVTETQKNSFIVLKARETGITAEQLEKVMNASYIYIPYIDKYKVSRDESDDKLNVEIAGGLIWYHVLLSDQSGLEKIAKVSATASVSQDKEGSWEKTKYKAVRSAGKINGLNLKTRTRELDMFKLLAPIAEVRGRKVKFPLGEKEGIKLDQPYYVGEWRKYNGETKFHKNGFIRVGSVAAAESRAPYISSAWAIKKGDWARGMMVMEHPRLGMDLSFKTRLIPFNIDSGLFVGEENNNGLSAVFASYSGVVPTLDIDLNVNIANATNVRQSFLTIGFTGAIVPAKSKVIYEDRIVDLRLGNLTIFEIIEERENRNSFGFYAGGNLGYLKKYYLGPWALHWEARAGIQAFNVTADFEDKVNLCNISLGGRINLGLEYALNIDTNIGLFVGFNAFPPVNTWLVKKDGDNVPVINDLDNYSWPRISSIGRTYGFYFHYSIPSIPFNPGSIVDASM